MQSFEEILASVLLLSRAEKLRVVDTLLESMDVIDPETDELIARELARRVEAIKSGRTQLIPLEEVLEQAQQILRSGSAPGLPGE